MGIIILIVILLGVSLLIVLNNRLVRKSNAIDQAYFSIDAMLKKRYELIPMLVEVVKAYMVHERDLLTELTRLRSDILARSLNVDARIRMDNQINECISHTIAVAENYPNLKSNPSFIHLQGSINDSEEQLAASRRFLNAAVADYHNAIESFPANLVAALRRMKRRNYFILDPGERVRPLFLINKP
jgi:LemA protein